MSYVKRVGCGYVNELWGDVESVTTSSVPTGDVPIAPYSPRKLVLPSRIFIQQA